MRDIKDLCARIEDELSKIAAFYMKYIGFDLTGKGLGIDLSDEISGKLSFNVGKVEVQDYKVIFSIDNRVPVTYRCMQVQELIQKHLSGSGFRFENPNATESIHIPKDSFLSNFQDSLSVDYCVNILCPNSCHNHCLLPILSPLSKEVLSCIFHYL